MIGRRNRPVTEAELETLPEGLYAVCDDARVLTQKVLVEQTLPFTLYARVRAASEAVPTGLDRVRIRPDGKQIVFQYVHGYDADDVVWGSAFLMGP